jgi:CheY-like chemotaxis protein
MSEKYTNPGPKHVSILLIEDSEEDVFFFNRAAARCGVLAEVTVASDGKAALALLSSPEKRSKFDVVFLDLKRPLISGFDVLRAVRKDDPERNLPIFILSGSSQEKDRETADAIGVAGYFAKPMTREKLAEVLSCSVAT